MERKRRESEWRNLVVPRRRRVLSSIERARGFVLCVLSFVFRVLVGNYSWDAERAERAASVEVSVLYS